MATKRGLGPVQIVVSVFIALLVGAICLGLAMGWHVRQIMQEGLARQPEHELALLYANAATYYEATHVTADGTTHSRCTVGSAITAAPSTVPRPPSPPSFVAIGWVGHEGDRFQYEIVGTAGCDQPPDTPVYTFRVYGDLDGDGIRSMHQLTAATNAHAALRRSPHLVVTNPGE